MKKNSHSEKKIHKKLFFLISLPRSGNTLIASILNQNPDLVCTGNSITLEILKDLCLIKEKNIFKNFPDHKSLDSVIGAVYDNYYKDWPQKYIIDRGPVLTSSNFNLINKYFNRPFKVIILWRDLIDVLASFMKWYKENPDAFPNKIGKNDTEILLKLMNNEGAIAKGLNAIQYALKSNYRSNCHLIKYNDFVMNPEKHIVELYKFLDIPHFSHYYQNLNLVNINGVRYDDTFLGKNMHKIRLKEVKKLYNPYIEQIPEKIKDMYGNITI